MLAVKEAVDSVRKANPLFSMPSIAAAGTSIAPSLLGIRMALVSGFSPSSPKSVLPGKIRHLSAVKQRLLTNT